MADTSKSQGQQAQADKQAAEQKTAEVAQQQSEQEQAQQQRSQEARSAAEKVLQAPAGSAAVDPFPAYDLLSLEDLRSLASERGVEINRDVERAHLITELRAADTGGLSASTLRGAR